MVPPRHPHMPWPPGTLLASLPSPAVPGQCRLSRDRSRPRTKPAPGLKEPGAGEGAREDGGDASQRRGPSLGLVLSSPGRGPRAHSGARSPAWGPPWAEAAPAQPSRKHGRAQGCCSVRGDQLSCGACLAASRQGCGGFLAGAAQPPGTPKVTVRVTGCSHVSGPGQRLPGVISQQPRELEILNPQFAGGETEARGITCLAQAQMRSEVTPAQWVGDGRAHSVPLQLPAPRDPPVRSI